MAQFLLSLHVYSKGAIDCQDLVGLRNNELNIIKIETILGDKGKLLKKSKKL